MNILFACQPASHNFAKPLLRHLEHTHLQNEHRVASMARDFDVVWLEWANAFAERALRHGRLDAFTVMRIHDWEIRSKRVQNFNFDHIDAIWFINPDAKEDFCELLPDVPEEKMFVLPNAIDMTEWPLVANGDRHIGLLCPNIQTRKRIDRAIELMELLPEYALTIRTSPEPHFTMKNGPDEMRRLADRVAPSRIVFDWRVFRGGPMLEDRSDVVDFWRNKSHTLTTSEHEGFCYAIAEGMACGAAPAVLEWEWGQPGLFYDHVQPDLESLAAWIRQTGPGDQWRTEIERFAAPAMAYKLEEELSVRLTKHG